MFEFERNIFEYEYLVHVRPLYSNKGNLPLEPLLEAWIVAEEIANVKVHYRCPVDNEINGSLRNLKCPYANALPFYKAAIDAPIQLTFVLHFLF